MSDNILDNHRYINVDDTDWYQCEVEHWTAKLELEGYEDVEIQFTGFCSQGDGASFTGNLRNAGLRKFMELHGLVESNRAVYAIAEHIDVWIGLQRTSSRYAHEYTVDVNWEMETIYEPDGDDLRETALYQLFLEAEAEFNGFAEVVLDISRSSMRKIYRDLERDYEYLTSDDAVRETLNMNNIAA